MIIEQKIINSIMNLHKSCGEWILPIEKKPVGMTKTKIGNRYMREMGFFPKSNKDHDLMNTMSTHSM